MPLLKSTDLPPVLLPHPEWWFDWYQRRLGHRGCHWSSMGKAESGGEVRKKFWSGRRGLLPGAPGL